jgi:hypothetical protein
MGPVHGGGCKHGQCLMPQGTICCLAVFNVVANPLVLWERFKEDMVEDFLYQAHQVGAQFCPCMALHVNLPCGFAWSWFTCCAALNAHYVVCVLL